MLVLFNVQIREGKYYRSLGDKNRMRLIPLEAPRGRVLDRNGKFLATNRPSYDITVSPEDVTENTIQLLAGLLSLEIETVKKRLKAPREYPFSPAVIQEDVGQKKAFEIEERLPELTGVFVQITGRRSYPYNNIASHLIGYIGKLNRKEYLKYNEDKSRYGYNSFVGRMGLEKIFDKIGVYA